MLQATSHLNIILCYEFRMNFLLKTKNETSKRIDAIWSFRHLHSKAHRIYQQIQIKGMLRTKEQKVEQRERKKMSHQNAKHEC